MMDNVLFELQPVLENDLLVLRPLRQENFEDLYAVASDPMIWEQHPAKDRCERKVFESFFRDAMLSKGAFAVIDKSSGQIIGSTRFHSIKETKQAIEIGWTFLARRFWGGLYNQAMKSLMIDYALHFVDDVLFYIDDGNMRSRRAVEKIGGRQVSELNGIVLECRAPSTVIYNIPKTNWRSATRFIQV